MPKSTFRSNLFYFILISCFFVTAGVTFSLKAQQVTSVLQVKVVDGTGNPVSGASVTIENGKPFTTDKSGRYKLFLDKMPALPIRAKVTKDGFRLAQLNFEEEENSVEIVMEPVVKEKKSIFGFIKVTKKPGVPVPGVTVFYSKKKYISDAQGIIKIAEKVDVKKIQVEGKAVEAIDEDANMNIVTISVTEKQVPDNDIEKFIAYKNSIENITSEIEEDGKQLVKDLVDVQSEIASITEKLKGDQNLTPERKKELKAYVDTLEQTLAKRRTEFEVAAVKTSSLIGILKKEIFSKDSLYNVARQQLASIEEEKKRTDEEYSRKVLIYSLGLSFLLIFAVFLYFFTVKLNKQKKQLEESNAQLQLQQQLVEEKNKQLDTFVYRASHDIKGPLKSVIGLTNVGLMAIKDPEALNYFDHISKSTKKLLKTLDNLLLLTKAERTQIKLEHVNVASLMEQALSSFENADGYKSLEFNIKIEKGMTLLSDETVLFSIFQNLIENGIKYHDPNKPQPYVDILAKYEGDKAVIKFTDNGLGVDKKHHAKIFDMFYKINDGSSGTGLGLHIVKQLIENLGGTIKLESEAGKGSTFSLVFPLNPMQTSQRLASI